MNTTRNYSFFFSFNKKFLIFFLPSHSFFANQSSDTVKGDICYVDAYRVSSVLHSLLDHLKLTKSYTLFIMNPKKPLPHNKQVYGYRTGFSKFEIDEIYNSDYKSSLLSAIHSDKIEGTRKLEKLERVKEKLQKGEQGKVKTTNFEEHSLEWAKWYISSYGVSEKDQIEGIPLACSYAKDEENKDIRCVSQSKVENLKIKEYAELISTHGADYEKRYLRDVIERGNFVQEECLVDAWVSHERFAFLDLSAGPFHWGPYFVSEGVKSEDTFPTFPKSNYTFQVHSKRIEKKLNTLKIQYTNMCFGDERENNKFICDSLTEKIRKITQETSEVKDFFFGNENGSDENIFLDYWLSDLGALISSSLRHIFSPGVPMFTTHYSERVSFDIFVITDHNSFDPLSADYLDISLLKKELLRFKLKKQEFSFNLRKIKMEDDPYVSVAFQNSLKSAVLPGKLFNLSFLKSILFIFIFVFFQKDFPRMDLSVTKHKFI